MKIDRLYTGFTLDGKERLLYQNDYYYDGDSSYSIYIDLNTNEIFNFMQVDSKNLIPFSTLLKNKKRISRRKVVDIYDFDRANVIKLSNLFIANVYKKVLQDTKNNVKKFEIIKKHILVKYDEEKDKYIDLFENKEYSRESAKTYFLDKFIDDFKFVGDIDSVIMLKDSIFLTKKKVLEKYHNGEIY